MEITIKFNESGRFSIEKSDDMGVFLAIGMLELAKKVLLEPDNTEEEEEINGQISLDVNDDMQ